MLPSIIAPTVVPLVECLESDVEFWEEEMVGSL
jgi:pentatricopeptide repeat protein